MDCLWLSLSRKFLLQFDIQSFQWYSYNELPYRAEQLS